MHHPLLSAIYLLIQKIRTSPIIMINILICLLIMIGILGYQLKHQKQQLTSYYQNKIDISALYSSYKILNNQIHPEGPKTWVNTEKEKNPFPFHKDTVEISTCPTQQEIMTLIQKNFSDGLDYIQKKYHCYPKKVEIKNSTFIRIELGP